MKKLLACFLLFAMAISLFGCSKQEQTSVPKKDPKDMTVRERIDSFEDSYEKSTEVKDFIEEHGNATYKSLYKINGIEYGRLISSSESAEDAVNVCTRHFTDNRYPDTTNTVVECKVIYESDLFYGVYVKWSYSNFGEGDIEYDENVISFKKNVADITVYNAIYEEENAYRICTERDEEMVQVVLYLFYHEYFRWSEGILEYESQSTDKDITLTLCRYGHYGGDWNIPDTICFYNQIIVVDKETGKIDFQEPSLLKEVEDWQAWQLADF